jgi:hypothetical protein
MSVLLSGRSVTDEGRPLRRKEGLCDQLKSLFGTMVASQTPAPAPTASVVGNTFVKQYYNLLLNKPSSLHRFYKDESSLTRCSESETSETVLGQRVRPRHGHLPASRQVSQFAGLSGRVVLGGVAAVPPLLAEVCYRDAQWRRGCSAAD